MSNRNNRQSQLSKRQDPVQLTPIPEMGVPKTKYSIPLRIPEGLHAIASSYSDSCGISLNSLICISLVEYLGERGYKIQK